MVAKAFGGILQRHRNPDGSQHGRRRYGKWSTYGQRPTLARPSNLTVKTELVPKTQDWQDTAGMSVAHTGVLP